MLRKQKPERHPTSWSIWRDSLRRVTSQTSFRQQKTGFNGRPVVIGIALLKMEVQHSRAPPVCATDSGMRRLLFLFCLLILPKCFHGFVLLPPACHQPPHHRSRCSHAQPQQMSASEQSSTSQPDILLNLLSPPDECDVDRMSSTDLAYIGDVVYELLVRSKKVWPPKRTSDLQNQVVRLVRGEWNGAQVRLGELCAFVPWLFLLASVGRVQPIVALNGAYAKSFCFHKQRNTNLPW